MCPLYIEDEESIGKKLYYRKIKYITSNNENFKVYLPSIINIFANSVQIDYHKFASFPAGFTLSLSLVETAYPIVNMFQVNKKEAKIT